MATSLPWRQVSDLRDAHLGTIDTEFLPEANGLTLDVVYRAQRILLRVIQTGIPGGYNQNGIVDAAFSVWLAAVGGTELANDSTPGGVDLSDYLFWKSNIGTAQAASSENATQVPEPSTWVLLLCA